ncbi:MAG: GNAT family N-acetyltransferase, partial [Vulcanimicrobiaceae bacterium]
MVEVEPIAPADYVRDVLPHSFAVWGDGRSLERYAADFLAAERTLCGPRGTFAFGVRDGGAVVVSLKRYERTLRWGARRLRAVGIGAVFTQPAARGRGFASAAIGAFLDAERARGTDLAFLFSDIHPHFYARLGFNGLPSRSATVRGDLLDGSPDDSPSPRPIEAGDWPAVGRCFDAMDRARGFSLARTPRIWQWLRLRWTAPAAAGESSIRLVVPRRNAVAAYVIGRRIERTGSFVIDDLGFSGYDGSAALKGVLRVAAGDLPRVSAWLSPEVTAGTLPRGAVRPRRLAILMLAPVSPLGRRFWRDQGPAILGARGDAVWNADHI